MKFLRLIAALAVAAASSAFAADVPLPQNVARVTTVEGITEYRLPNGLRILFAADASKPTTTVNLTYLVGSRHENYGETGMAHLLEHLMGFGTPTYPNARAEADRRGMRRNASTSVDRTNYFASFSANEESLDWYVAWLADAMTHSFIAKKDLDTEMTVVRNEMENGENNPVGSLLRQALGTAFQWHNYGKSTIGARSDVENVPIERLQAFYRTHYRPDNAVLVVSGKFDEAKTLTHIAREFGKVARPTAKLQGTYTLDPEQQGERSITLRRAGETPAVMAMYHVPAGPHPDFTAMQLLNVVMADPAAGRLHKSLVETKLAGQVLAQSIAGREPGVSFFVAVLPSGASPDLARAALLDTLEGLNKNPVTDAEVERARATYLKEFELNAADPERVGLALSASIAQGDWRLFFLQRDRAAEIKTADVQRVAAAYLVPDNRTLGTFIPTSAPIRPPAPQLVDVDPMVKDYKGRAAVAAGEAFEATPAAIEARVQRTQLANGMKVALLPKRTRGATVHARIVIRYGDEKSLFGMSPVQAVTAAMLDRGAAGMSREQIRDAFNQLKARVSFQGGDTRLNVSVETTRENLAKTLALVAKVVRNPDFPATQLDLLKTERATQVEAQSKEPEPIARLALQRHGSPYPRGDVRYPESFEEQLADLKAVTLERVKSFHADFYGADHADFAAVGDFDPAELQSHLATLFGDWKSAKPHRRVANPLFEPKAAGLRMETPDKANAFFVAQAHFAMRDDAPDYPAALVANRIMGGGPSSILFSRIRTKEGLSYGAYSQLTGSSYEPHATWSAFAIYAPQNRAKVEAAFGEELSRVMRDGFTEKELAAAKNGLLQARQLQLAQDAQVAALLASHLELGRTLAYVDAIDKGIEAATLEQVNAAFRKNVEAGKLVAVYAGDFARNKP
jgi:zinc protease